MIMVGGRVEHNPLAYTLFYEAKTEEAENYSQIFTCMKIHAQGKVPTFVSENGDGVAFVRELAGDGAAQCNKTNVLL
jgi:hypothetical protein